LSGLSKIFGRRASEDDRSVGTASTAVESVMEEEEEDADVMVMRSTRGKGKERAA
jgi:nucleotide-binding universal stress UspA family protein